ncbi:MAG: hypothetical protein ACFB21_14370 [Opitutales bacterium]
MNQQGFTDLLEQYGWTDEWWVAVDGSVLDGRMNLKDACGLKRQVANRQVALLHPRAPDTIGVQWHPLEVSQATPPQPRLARKTATPPPVGKKGGAPRGGSGESSEQQSRMLQQILEMKADLTETQIKMTASFNEVRTEVRQLREAFEEMIDLKRFKQQLDERRRTLEQSEQMLIKKAFKQDAMDDLGGASKAGPAQRAVSGSGHSGPPPGPGKSEPEPPSKPPAPSRSSSRQDDKGGQKQPSKADLEALLPGRPVETRGGEGSAKPPPPVAPTGNLERPAEPESHG